MDGACTRAEGEALAELRNAPRTPVPLSLSLDRRRIAREEEEEEESARGSSEGEERRRRSEIEWSSGGEGWCTVEGKRGMKRPSFCRVIRGLPRGICYPRERKSRDSRGFARAARLGSPIMSISNTTNCTQPNGEYACVCVCVRFDGGLLRGLPPPPPIPVHAPVHAASNSSSSSPASAY